MAISRNFTIQRVFEADYYDILTEKPLFKLDQLTECVLSNGQETVYSTDGDGANIAPFSHSKTASGTMTSAVFNADLLGVITGTEVETGQYVVPHNEKLVVKDGKVTLTHIPTGVEGKEVILMLYNNDGSFGDEFTQVTVDPENTMEFKLDITTGEITFLADDVADNTNLIAYYDYETAEGTINIKNRTSQFSKVCRIVLTGLGVDVCTMEEVPIKVVYYRAKVDGTWELSTSKGGDPSTLACNFEALKRSCIDDELFDIYEINEE